MVAMGVVMMSVLGAGGAGVGDVGGAPMLKIDGKPVVPLMFMGWWGANARTVEVTPQWQKIVVEFVAPETAEGAPGFQVRVGGGSPGKVWIDDLRYYEGTPDKPVGPNMQPHGDFEDVGAKLPDNWAVYCYADQGAKATSAIDDAVAEHGSHSLRIDVENPATAPIHVHLYLSGCKVERGKHYTVELWMKAEPKRNVDVQPLHMGEPWTLYPILHQDNVFMDQVRLAAGGGRAPAVPGRRHALAQAGRGAGLRADRCVLPGHRQQRPAGEDRHPLRDGAARHVDGGATALAELRRRRQADHGVGRVRGLDKRVVQVAGGDDPPHREDVGRSRRGLPSLRPAYRRMVLPGRLGRADTVLRQRRRRELPHVGRGQVQDRRGGVGSVGEEDRVVGGDRRADDRGPA